MAMIARDGGTTAGSGINPFAGVPDEIDLMGAEDLDGDDWFRETLGADASEGSSLPSSMRRDAEGVIGVESIEDVQTRRRTAVERAAPLRAKYGAGGSFEARRKALRSLYIMEIKQEHESRSAKVPAWDLLEAMGSADERYRALLDVADRERAELEVLEDEIRSYTEIINRDQGILRFRSNEPR